MGQSDNGTRGGGERGARRAAFADSHQLGRGPALGTGRGGDAGRHPGEPRGHPVEIRRGRVSGGGGGGDSETGPQAEAGGEGRGQGRGEGRGGKRGKLLLRFKGMAWMECIAGMERKPEK